MTLQNLATIMRENGVCGAGGAGFPSYAKLNDKADTIILNCAECEPLLRLHRQMLEKYAFEILTALDTVAQAVGADNIIIAVKRSYKDAIAAVESNLASFKKARIGYLPEAYPSGDEVVTIYETTGRVIKPGKLPITEGVIVYNVETMFNTYNALNNIPVTEKYVTVTGAVKNPVTVKVPLGTDFKTLIDLAGGATIEDYEIINGGPMTGGLAGKFELVTKTSNAVIVLPKDHYIVEKRKTRDSISLKRAMASCCQCRTCTDLCPRNLLGHPIDPANFMKSASSGNAKDIKTFLDTFSCCSCGVCELYACRQELSPRSLIAAYKAGLRANGVTMPQDMEYESVSTERPYRIVPMGRLISRIGLKPYNKPAPLDERAVMPDVLKIKLSQHIGAPAKPIVKKGDKVTKGQILAASDADKLGVNIHCPMDGTVRDINDTFITVIRG